MLYLAILKSSEKTKDGRLWYFKTYINGKQYKSKKYTTKREAADAEMLFVKSNERKDLEAHKITFNEAIKEYLEAEKEKTKPSTYKQEVKLCEHISEALGPIVIEKLTVNQYKDFRTSLINKDLSVPYCNKIINHCKSVIKLAYVRYGTSTRVPEGFSALKDNSIKKEIDFYSPDEFKAFLGAIDTTEYKNIKWYAFFTVSYYMGTRCGENNALTWKDIDFNKRTININKTVNTKMKDDAGNYLVGSPKTKGSYRVLPMPNNVYNALLALKQLYMKYEGFSEDWYCYGGIKPLSETNIHKYNKLFSEAANIKTISVHGYRHSCCSYLLNKGCNILLISKYLGHSDTQKALNTYSHLMPNQLNEAVELLNLL